MEARVDGKIALVTGGSRGIGQATVLALVEAGAAGVVFTSRKPPNIEESMDGLVDSGASPDLIQGIVAKADVDEDATRAIETTIDRFGGCDILVNNAGTNPAAGPLMDVDLGALDKTWRVNQRAPLIWARAAYHGWMHTHGGAIVNVASVGGIRPSPLIGAYNVSKAALIHLTHQLAFELAPDIRVNAVAPGVVKTRLSAMLWESGEEAAAGTHPLERLGTPEEVAGAIVYLASDMGSWLTGVVLPVDGGVIGAAGALT